MFVDGQVVVMVCTGVCHGADEAGLVDVEVWMGRGEDGVGGAYDGADLGFGRHVGFLDRGSG